MTTPQKIRRRQWFLISLLGLTAILAVGALVVALKTNSDNNTRANQERVQARYSNCELLRQIVFVATPPGRQDLAREFLNKPRNPLSNCNRYATTTEP